MLLLWCCYLKSRMGHFRPTFWARKKTRHFYLSLALIIYADLPNNPTYCMYCRSVFSVGLHYISWLAGQHRRSTPKCVFSLGSFACWGRHHLPWAILAWPIESPKSFCLASKFPHLSGKRAECNLASVCNQVPSVQEFARLAIWHQESPKVIPTQTTKIQKITNA